MHKYEPTIETDSDGRLFDPRLRVHMAGPEPADNVAREALAAMRAASHAFRVGMDRWLDKHGLSEGRVGVLWMLWNLREVLSRLSSHEQQLEVVRHFSFRSHSGIYDGRMGIATDAG